METSTSAEEEGYVSVNGQRLRYRVRGEGPPLMFVHGWTLNLECWDAQADFFATRYRVYRYDWRGMGRSSGATPAFTMAELGEELKGVIDAFGLKKPIVCGHSEGGAIAAQYAATHPDDLVALILADTDLNSRGEELAGVMGLGLTDFFAMLEERAGHDPLAAMMPNLEKQFYSAGFIAKRPDAIAAWRAQFLTNSVSGVLHGLRAWDLREDLGGRLGALRAPTLLLWGMEDAMIPLALMQRLQGCLRTPSQLATLAGSGHMTPVEIPGRFNRAIYGFLSAHLA